MLLKTTYGQRDSRWSKEPLGSSNSTIGGYGCAVTSLAMLCEYVGISTTPYTLNKWLTNNAGYQNGSYIFWDAINRYTSNAVVYSGTGVPTVFPQVAEVDLIPTNSTFDQHFVIATSMTDCFDPWENRYRLLSEFGRVKSWRNYNYKVVETGVDMVDREYRNAYYTALTNVMVKLSPSLDLPTPDKWADNLDVLAQYTVAFTDRVTSRLVYIKDQDALIAKLKSANNDLSAQIKDLNDEVTTLNGEAAEARLNLNEQTERLATAKETITARDTTIKGLQETNSGLTKDVNRLKGELLKAKRPTLINWLVDQIKGGKIK